MKETQQHNSLPLFHIPPQHTEEECDDSIEHSLLIAQDDQITLEWIAVLSSQTIPYTLIRLSEDMMLDTLQEHGIWGIEIDNEQLNSVSKHIKDYEAERHLFTFKKLHPEYEIPLPSYSRPFIGIFMVAVLSIFYIITGAYRYSNPFFLHGSMNCYDVVHGEWWRTITALFLHNDVMHLVGNIAFLFLFSIPINNRFGPGVTCFMIFLSGILGNIGTTFIRLIDHNYIVSFGASTAVFGALGILTGIGVMISIKHLSRRYVFYGIFSGFVLLGMTGVGPKSDVLAHCMGFLFGILLGVYSHKIKRENIHLQWFGGIISIILFFLSWYIALK
jgi:membrane associated rhomboid family serine protease